MSDYVRLKERNDWGHVYFALPGRDLTKNGGAAVSLGITFKDGETIPVRWPSGKTGPEKIKMMREHDTVSDMGHSYPVEFKVPHIVQEVHGIESLIRISLVEVSREWAEERSPKP